MKKLLLLSSALVTLAACSTSNSATPTTGTTQATTTVTTTKALEKFVFTNKLFSVKANDQWVSIHQTDDAQLELVGYGNTSYIGFSTLPKTNAVSAELKSAAKIVFQGALKTYNITTFESKETKVAGFNAITTSVEATVQGSKVKNDLFMVEAGDYFIFIVASTESDAYDTAKEDILSIVNSLTKE